jgi:hypothetical protein
MTLGTIVTRWVHPTRCDSQRRPASARALVLEAAGRKQLGQQGAADTALAEALAIADRTGARIVELDAARLGLA